jgi:diaminopimelate epimerase
MIFEKYQGTGNDFVIIDNRTKDFPKDDVAIVSRLCHRRFGIGADGLILIEEDPGADFKMIYFNSDGKESTMCGNGGRCAAAFAHSLGLMGEKGLFMAIDGPHEAVITEELVKLRMIDVTAVEKINNDQFILDTGSPHYVKIMEDDIALVHIVPDAHKIRYNDRFKDAGINLNFINISPANKISVRTYERGVEDETYSCGTGVVASAISAFLHQHPEMPERDVNSFLVSTKGGELEVTFSHKRNSRFENIWLIGPAEKVFEGMF